MTFEEFGLDEQLMEGIYSMGFKTPSPIQQQAIPYILEGKDLIACAQTGTGKTAAYLLPALNRVATGVSKDVSTLIIAPTRELALQIDQQIEALSYFLSVSSIAIYGGGDGINWAQQKRALASGTDVVVATPGRLLAMLQTEEVCFDKLQMLVLDEADKMLDMGFYEDIVRIIKALPAERQTLLFSATMPPKIRSLANSILKDPQVVNIAISKPAEKIDQQIYVVYDPQKEGLLLHLLSASNHQSIIIFANTKEDVKKLGHTLKRNRFRARAFHSDLDQNEREEIMQKFKSGQVNILVGTNILSRGIDVDGIGLVINYNAPAEPEDYIHRIGRTARAEAEGTAVTLVSPKDWHKLFRIERLLEREIPRQVVPQQLGETPANRSYKEQNSNSAGPKPPKRKPKRKNKPSNPSRNKDGQQK